MKYENENAEKGENIPLTLLAPRKIFMHLFRNFPLSYLERLITITDVIQKVHD